MASLVHQCPHPGCLTVRMNFDMHVTSWTPGAKENQIRNFIHASCRGCGQPVAFELADDTGRGRLGPDAAAYPMSLDQMGWHIVKVWPSPPRPRLPAHLPDAVSKAFLAAERNVEAKGLEEAAAGSYGRAIDIGTKLFAPDLEKDTLAARINKLADQNRITRDLASWAHEIRFIRNYAMHALDDISRDELIAIRGFAEMVLTYLFTLPGMLQERQRQTSVKPAGKG